MLTSRQWYSWCVDTTYSVVVGDRGRLVLPVELRARQQWEQGTPLMLVETAGGVVIMTRSQAKDLVRDQLAGESLVAALVTERRDAARSEDAA